MFDSMEFVDPNLILTLEEAAQILKLKDSLVLQHSIRDGSLAAFRIGLEQRIVGKDFNEFIQNQRQIGSSVGSKGSSSKGRLTATQMEVTQMNLKAGKPFIHVWPDGTPSDFRDVLEGPVKTAYKNHAVRLGVTNWIAAERDRERVVVFVDGRPMVEFVAANDYKTSNLMASIIKISGKQVKPVLGTPNSYRHLKVRPYNDFVVGKYASSNLAVVCDRNDTKTMLEHALIRWGDVVGC